MISNTPGITTAAFAQMQQQQAQRAAEQAEQRAQSLQAETRRARADAERAQDRVRTLEVETSQAERTAERARGGIAASESLQQLDGQLSTLQEDIRSTFPTPADGEPPPRPVVNAQGQLTGTVINVAV